MKLFSKKKKEIVNVGKAKLTFFYKDNRDPNYLELQGKITSFGTIESVQTTIAFIFGLTLIPITIDDKHIRCIPITEIDKVDIEYSDYFVEK